MDARRDRHAAVELHRHEDARVPHRQGARRCAGAGSTTAGFCGAGPAESARTQEAAPHGGLRRQRGLPASTILRYFGDPVAAGACDSCSNCSRRSLLGPESLLQVRKILAGIARAGERFGRRRIAAMLVGAMDDLPPPLTSLSTTGLLAGEDAKTIERLIDAACGAGLIAPSRDEYRTLRAPDAVGPRRDGRPGGRRAACRIPPVRPIPTRRARKRRLRLESFPARVSRQTPVAPAAASAASPGPPDEATVAALREWRVAEARRRAIAPFIILHDRTLMAIAAARPRSTAELLDVPGIGPGKAEKYGEAIVSLVRPRT